MKGRQKREGGYIFGMKIRVKFENGSNLEAGENVK